MLTVKVKNKDLYLYGTENFSLSETLDCGQAFRWESDDNGRWHGVAGNKYLEIYRDADAVIFKNTSLSDFKNFWYNYFDLERNYGEIIKTVSQNKTIAEAIKFADGIRILNQDPWEALCSFIISQNNNIPRIKGIIDRLCENFGENLGGYYSFPTAETISKLYVEDLEVLRCGFRAKYIIDAAKKVTDKTVDLEALRGASYEVALESLMQINGVGPKVADCTLLFSLGHIEAFPKDVWIKRAMDMLFDGELPECAKEYAGIVQQYIFHYSRIKKIGY